MSMVTLTVISALRGLRQEVQGFNAIVDYIVEFWPL